MNAMSTAAPQTPPPSDRDVRGELAAEFLRGDGLEIGALHLAMPIPPGAKARYVDRMSVADLRQHYPELRDWDLAHVDVIDDGEMLQTIEPGSVDFIVANHFLEHCQDPIQTITNHLGKLRPGGILFYAVPDRRYTFDFRRDRTPLQHHVEDHERGFERSRSAHYLEWTTLVDPGPGALSDEQARIRARQLEAEDYSIHFHVWEESDLIALLLHVHERLRDFDIEAVRRNGIENIVVLRKSGVPGDPITAKAVHPPARSESPAASAPAPRLPLARLRSRLDPGGDGDWQINPDGVIGRCLLMAAETEYAVPLRLNTPVQFETTARLMPHDWRDGMGTISARVLVSTPSGLLELWAQPLASSSDLGLPEGHRVTCEIPAEATSLILSVQGQPSRERGVARALWVEPTILSPAVIPDSPAVAGRSATLPAADVTRPPLFSVLTPVHDPSPEMLRACVDSVRSQTFEDWELCLVDDGSRNPVIIELLRQYAEDDVRIKLTRREHGGGIADATNAAIALASGEYVALLDHDDWLSDEALASVAARIAAEPDLDMLYTDEDIVLDGTPVWTHLKPGWSIDTLRTNGYTCHLGVYRRSLIAEIGGFRSEFNGSQDVDMILRLTERTDRIAHVPGIHYFWRIHPDSTAGGDAKPYAYVAARNAIAEHLQRSAIDAEVDYGPPGLYRVVHRVTPGTRVALILAIEDLAGLDLAARSWAAQPHRAWEVVLAGPRPLIDEATFGLRLAGVGNHRIKALITEGLDRHEALSAAVAQSDCELLLLMQTPACGLTGDWMTRLMGYAGQPGIGAAGPLGLGANGRVQEGGVAMPDGWPLPLLYDASTSMDHHFGYGTSVYDVSAVSGLLATRRSIYDRLGGLRPSYAELALVDYCLRAGDSGLRTVLVPDARVQVTGHDRTMNDLPRMAALRRERQAHPPDDPFYNPLQRTDRGDFARR